ncbi:MAG: hypothetical protein JWM74_5845 [Myxococcaceae bacterium]|nr:hypothetical protein [Myxococcaceae bacterium]
MKHTKRTAQKSGKAASASGQRATSRSTPTTRGRLAPAVRELSSAMADALEDILRAERRSRLS